MTKTEHLFEEYKVLTDKYLATSQQLRDLLYSFVKLPQTDKLPDITKTKELLGGLSEIEEQIEELREEVKRLKAVNRVLMLKNGIITKKEA